jgi:hypothetical protein
VVACGMESAMTIKITRGVNSSEESGKDRDSEKVGKWHDGSTTEFFDIAPMGAE